MALKKNKVNPTQIGVYTEEKVTVGFEDKSITNQKLKSPASGDCQYTTFGIDLDTGMLTAMSDPDFVNTEFELINGMLVVKIN